MHLHLIQLNCYKLLKPSQSAFNHHALLDCHQKKMASKRKPLSNSALAKFILSRAIRVQRSNLVQPRDDWHLQL